MTNAMGVYGAVAQMSHDPNHCHEAYVLRFLAMTRTLDDSQPDGFQETHNSNSLKRTLLLPNHTAAASARPTIPHSQLRHLITCPQRRGIVYYVSGEKIVESDLLRPHLPIRTVISLKFPPTCFSATTVTSNPHAILFAAGGQKSELHVSLHSFSPATTTTSPPPPDSTSTSSPDSVPPPPPKLIWEHDVTKACESEIVNTIMFTPTSLTDDTRRSGSSASDFRMVVGGNNRAVHFYDIILQPSTKNSQRVQLCGQVTLETCVNHVSISPNGRTLMCVGDTSKVYLYHLSPGTNVTFFPIATYDLPRPPPFPYTYTFSPTIPPPNFRSIACFSSAWSPDSLKFAVGSQEGQLCVWDVRSAWPIFQYWTPYRANHKWKESYWDSNASTLDENGPDSGIRSVKFTGGESGRELLIWVEQTINLHVIDARTFDLATHSIIPFPDLSHLVPPQDPVPVRLSSPSPSLIELSPASSTDSLVEGNSSRATTETGTGTTATGTTATTITDTTVAALSRRAEAGSVITRLFTRTPSPPTLPLLPPPPPLPPADPASSTPSPTFENDTWWPVSRPPSAPSNISHIVRTSGDIQRRRERLSRQRMSIMEQLQREGSGSPGPLQPQQQQQQQHTQQQRRDTLNDLSGNLSTRNMALRRERVEAMLEAHRNDRGVVLSSRNMRSLLPAITREEISAEIRTLIDDTRARIAALNGDGNNGGAGGDLPQTLRSLAEEFEDGNVQIGDAGVSNGGVSTSTASTGPVQISGLCLDSTGGWVYVAGSTGIVEWRVREREEGRGGASSGWV